MATDLSDPIIVLTIAQTVILTLTMVVFIFSFRSQNLAIKDAAYQKALDDYTASISMLAQSPDLRHLIDEMRADTAPGSEAAPLADKDRAVFSYMLLNYSLFERVYLLHAKKWIDDETWGQWHAWMKDMARHPMFQEVHNRSQGTFDRSFMELVEDAVKRAA